MSNKPVDIDTKEEAKFQYRKKERTDATEYKEKVQKFQCQDNSYTYEVASFY